MVGGIENEGCSTLLYKVQSFYYRNVGEKEKMVIVGEKRVFVCVVYIALVYICLKEEKSAYMI